MEKKKSEMEGCGDVGERRSGKEMKGEEVGEGDFTSDGNDFFHERERKRKVEEGRTCERRWRNGRENFSHRVDETLCAREFMKERVGKMVRKTMKEEK